jgi:hypothetical protein
MFAESKTPTIFFVFSKRYVLYARRLYIVAFSIKKICYIIREITIFTCFPVSFYTYKAQSADAF